MLHNMAGKWEHHNTCWLIQNQPVRRYTTEPSFGLQTQTAGKLPFYVQQVQPALDVEQVVRRTMVVHASLDEVGLMRTDRTDDSTPCLNTEQPARMAAPPFSLVSSLASHQVSGAWQQEECVMLRGMISQVCFASHSTPASVNFCEPDLTSSVSKFVIIVLKTAVQVLTYPLYLLRSPSQ